MRITVPCLAMLVLTAALTACGGGDATRLQLGDLARFADRYDGERVSTVGTVRSFDAPEHYWIEDADLHRVALPATDDVRSRVGERVRVIGRFHASRERGRSLEPERIEPAG